MTIAEKNAKKWPEELGDINKSTQLIQEWAKDTTRLATAEYTTYKLPCERGVWDTSDENGSLLPSDASYTCLLEPQ